MSFLNILVSLAAFIWVTEGVADSPIKAIDYRNYAKQGFSTNYFKGTPPLRIYNDKNIQDVYDKGFRNLRLRCDAGLYQAPYNDAAFNGFLADLTSVVDKCLAVGVFPIISWIHHEAEAWATEEQHQNYLNWWKVVATQLKDKDYRLAFNLFTELGKDVCKDDCSQSLRENTKKYNEWTRDVIAEIRATGGNNAQRIIILASPKKTAKGLSDIDVSILNQYKPYVMAEFHLYASGPTNTVSSQKYWSGDGSDGGKDNVKNALQPALDFTVSTGVPTYFGAWMAEDNLNGGLAEDEVIIFSRYFVKQLKKNIIPWSLNVLDRYYETKENRWRDEVQTIKKQKLNMKKVLNTIINNM